MLVWKLTVTVPTRSTVRVTVMVAVPSPSPALKVCWLNCMTPPGSSSTITPIPLSCPAARVAPCGFDSWTKKFSSPSGAVSGMMGTLIVFVCSPCAKETVPVVF